MRRPFDCDLAPVAFDNRLNDRKTETGALNRLFVERWLPAELAW